MKKQMTTRNSKEEKEFIKSLEKKISHINTFNILNSRNLENIIQELAIAIEDLWNRYSKYINITKYSKE